MGKDKDSETPSVRELEALEQKDRKETEDLLSGFDRPGRTPRTPRVRDFVDYYSSPSGRSAPVPPSQRGRREETSPHEKPTVVVPRKQGLSTTMMWALAVVGMIVFGATIAILATPSAPPAPPPGPMMTLAPTAAPTSATTITSANPQSTEETIDTVIVATPPQKKTAPSTSVNGATTAPTIKTAPRDDFIRDM